RVAERALARAVRTHDRVHFSGVDDEVESTQDLVAGSGPRLPRWGDVQPIDPEQFRGCELGRLAHTADSTRARGDYHYLHRRNGTGDIGGAVTPPVSTTHRIGGARWR